MAEEKKQPLVLALARGYNGFYCPETRFHLIGVMRPSAVYPHDTLSEDVKRGLRSGVLIDVNKVLTEEDIKPGKNFNYFVTSGDRKKQMQQIAEENIKKQVAEDKKNGVEKDDYVTQNLSKVQGDILSEPDILASTKKDLLAYIEKVGLELDELGLSARSTADEVREALLKHFGYNQKPVDVTKIAEDTE